MSLDHAILGFLSEEALSGYDIKTRCLDERTSHFWTADQAQVYRTLDRLERSRLVTARRERQTGKPDRKVYSITRAGRDALGEWLATPHPVPSYRDPFLIQLYFGAELQPEQLIAVLETTRGLRQERLAALRERTSRHARESGMAADLETHLHRMTLDAAMAQERFAIDWLDDSIEMLEALAHDDSPQRTLFGKRLPGGDA